MQLYNTLSHKKEHFEPARAGAVGLYACGITAYDFCHIGHARSAVVFDVLVRYLRSTGLEVTFIRNFTDVDDKIINRALAENKSSDEIAQTYIQAFHEDMDRLDIQRADIEPKATEHITEMIALCLDLIQKGHAYATASGDVYFRVRSFAEYGKLSGRTLDEMQAGARVIPGEEKEDPLDFALWKAAKPGEPFWQSPWGTGRPGWHIECSAMSEKYWPLPLDIHGGGQDLIFPHHENEIAQSEASLGKQLARFWVHNGFVQINAEKMSKSLGNFKTIRDILNSYLPETLRFFLLGKQYRSPIDFSFENMDEAEKALKRIYEGLRDLDQNLQRENWKKNSPALAGELVAELAQYQLAFSQAMEDDLNTAAALGHIFSTIRLANRIHEDKQLRNAEAGRTLLQNIQQAAQHWAKILGLFNQPPVDFLLALRNKQAQRKNISPAHVEELIATRQKARAEKNFELSDTLRAQLAEMNIEIRDTPNGMVWDIA